MILDLIAEKTPMRDARSLSRTIMQLVAEGEIPEGAKMPTVRAVAERLGMSPASVAVAWSELVKWHVFETRRRAGTFVLGPALAPGATRFDVMMRAAEGISVNLGHSTPDPKLLPDLTPAFTHAAGQGRGIDMAYDTISPTLEQAVRPNWPFEADMMMATHGGIAAIDMALRVSLRAGDRVIVDVPSVSRIFDILEALNAKPIPVVYGPEGPDLEQLARAVQSRPAAMIYQPASNHPSGLSASGDWMHAAAALLSGLNIPIIELVQAPLMLRQPPLSLGRYLPEKVIHIHAYNFFFGPDLRVGVAAGSAEYIERMWRRFTFSSGWVSRILQDALAFQLTDPGAQEDLARFVHTCATRKTAFIEALRRRGFDLHDSTGPAIWLPVNDEYVVTTQLSSMGIVVHPGSYFSATDLERDHVLINGTSLTEGYDEMAEKIARADRDGFDHAREARNRGR